MGPIYPALTGYDKDLGFLLLNEKTVEILNRGMNELERSME